MKLPKGVLIAETSKPLTEIVREYGNDFKGCIKLFKAEDDHVSEGFILMGDGDVLASAYSVHNIKLYQFNALERMMSLSNTICEVVAYTDGEAEEVILNYPDSMISEHHIHVPKDRKVVEKEEKPVPEPIVPGTEKKPGSIFDTLLLNIVSLPGVMASSLVADGFPIYQYGGNVDFEHIAVATEDMVRAGIKIATELQLGKTDQIILETNTYKVIIAPISDMFLCVLAKADANLGLVRLTIKNAQNNVKDV